MVESSIFANSGQYLPDTGKAPPDTRPKVLCKRHMAPSICWSVPDVSRFLFFSKLQDLYVYVRSADTVMNWVWWVHC